MEELMENHIVARVSRRIIICYCELKGFFYCYLFVLHVLAFSNFYAGNCGKIIKKKFKTHFPVKKLKIPF